MKDRSETRLGKSVSRKSLPPGIGLALGGGGVRGLAHLGVLSVLRKAGIPIRAISGSSMGAIVGTLVSLDPDFDLAALTEKLLSIARPISEKVAMPRKENTGWLDRLRQFLHIERFLWDTLWGWGEVPGSLASATLKKLTEGKLLEEGKIPVAVVTTDLLSGEKVVFSEGPAHLALQASSALPGFFPPVRHQSRLLTDGAFVDYVPVDLARSMTDAPVIAVEQENLPVEINNGLEAILRAVELCARHHKEHQLRLADGIIHPKFGEFVPTFDLSRAEQCVQAGIRAAEAFLPALKEVLSTGEERT